LKSLYKMYDKLLGYITKGAAMVAGLGVLVTAFIIFYEVIARGLFHAPTEWVMEYATYLLIFSGFLGMAYTMRVGGHIRVDFLFEKFPRGVRRALDILTSLLSVFLMYVCTTESWNYMEMSREMGIVSPSTIRFPMWIPQLFMVIGFALLWLEVIDHLLEDFFNFEKEGD